MNAPDFPGLETFTGPLVPHRPLAARGRRLHRPARRLSLAPAHPAIQAIPQIARQAEQLFVFQRTPNFSIPAHNAPLDADTQRQIKADYPERRQRGPSVARRLPLDPPDAQRARGLSRRSGSAIYEAAGRRAASARSTARSTTCSSARRRTRRPPSSSATRSARPSTTRRWPRALLPEDYPFGTKRLCVDIDYYETYNRPNVTLVDVRRDADRRNHPDGHSDTIGGVRSWTASCSPPVSTR